MSFSTSSNAASRPLRPSAQRSGQGRDVWRIGAAAATKRVGRRHEGSQTGNSGRERLGGIPRPVVSVHRSVEPEPDEAIRQRLRAISSLCLTHCQGTRILPA